MEKIPFPGVNFFAPDKHGSLWESGWQGVFLEN
jgi:hypothetical protein